MRPLRAAFASMFLLGGALSQNGCEETEPASPAAPGSSSEPSSTTAPPTASIASSANMPATDQAIPDNAAKATLSGRSLSIADGGNVSDALKSVGWMFRSSGGMGVGSRKTTTIKADKGELKAEIVIVQPTGKPEAGIGTIRSATEQEAELRQKNAATYLEGETLIAVTIENNQPEARKLLDALVHNQVKE